MLVKPLPVTERTQLLYKAHRCVPRPHPYTDPRDSLMILEVLFASSIPSSSSPDSWRRTQFPRRRNCGPLGFSSFTCPREGFSFPQYRLWYTSRFFFLHFFLSFFIFFYSRLISREILIPTTIKINTILPIEAYLTRTTEIPIHGPLHRGVEDGLILRCVDKSVSDSL